MYVHSPGLVWPRHVDEPRILKDVWPRARAREQPSALLAYFNDHEREKQSADQEPEVRTPVSFAAAWESDCEVERNEQ